MTPVDYHIDGTIVRSKKRRNDRPESVKSIVTNLTKMSAGIIRKMAAWCWGVEVTIKALKRIFFLQAFKRASWKESPCGTTGGKMPPAGKTPGTCGREPHIRRARTGRQMARERRNGREREKCLELP
jgi:hypothetical protein